MCYCYKWKWQREEMQVYKEFRQSVYRCGLPEE